MLSSSSPDAFKLPTTFTTTGVVHSCPNSTGPDEVWTDVSIIGHGGQGTVYLQQLQSGSERRLRAVKELSPDLRTGHLKRELNTMMALRDHEDLFVKLFGWFEDPRGTVFLAMEYVPHGDLAAYIKTTPNEQREAREVTRQLLTGLAMLHSRHICHRDLKPQNVLLASLVPIKVKLADFGVSKSTAGTDLRTRIGTVNYMAPEQLGLLPLRLRPRVEYTTAVDMWALGLIVHELLTGHTPFLETPPVDTLSSGYPTALTEDVTIDMRLMLQFCDGNVELPRELLHDKDPAAVSFIESLVVPDPVKRSSAALALLHPWITGGPTKTMPETKPASGIPKYYQGGYVVPPVSYNPWAAEKSSVKLHTPVGRLVKPPGATTQQERELELSQWPRLPRPTEPRSITPNFKHLSAASSLVPVPPRTTLPFSNTGTPSWFDPFEPSGRVTHANAPRRSYTTCPMNIDDDDSNASKPVTVLNPFVRPAQPEAPGKNSNPGWIDFAFSDTREGRAGTSSMQQARAQSGRNWRLSTGGPTGDAKDDQRDPFTDRDRRRNAPVDDGNPFIGMDRYRQASVVEMDTSSNDDAKGNARNPGPEGSEEE